MAIMKIPAPGSSPSSINDWSAVVSQLLELVTDKEGQRRIVGSNVAKGSFFSIGGALYVADADTAIAGVQSDYAKIIPSGSSATAIFSADLTGVAWNSTYKGYYDGAGNLYIFDEVKAFGGAVVSSLLSEESFSPSQGMAKVISDPIHTNMATPDVIMDVPNTSYQKYNRSATTTKPAGVYSNSGYANVAKITFSNINGAVALLRKFRLLVTNGDSDSLSTMRLIMGAAVLSTWADAASHSEDVVVSPDAEVDGPVDIYLQYLEYGASDIRGPFGVTVSMGLCDDADLPSLAEMIYNMTGGAVTVVAV